MSQLPVLVFRSYKSWRERPQSTSTRPTSMTWLMPSSRYGRIEHCEIAWSPRVACALDWLNGERLQKCPGALPTPRRHAARGSRYSAC